MKFYYYEIRNKQTDKCYIGITTNPQVRKNTHFRKLRNGEHPNPILQNGFNKYGEDSFVFNIIGEKDCDRNEAYAYESFLIQTRGNYPNGYNCNIGGFVSGPRGDFTEEEVYEIIAAAQFMPGNNSRIAEVFGCPSKKTIQNIASGTNYHYYYVEYQKLSVDEQKAIFDNFCERTNFKTVCATHRRNNGLRKLTPEQVYMVCYQDEFHYPKRKKDLIEDFHMSNYSIMQQIRNGRSYAADVYNYSQMSLNEKYEVACHYAEMHNRKPPELLETPSGTISS